MPKDPSPQDMDSLSSNDLKVSARHLFEGRWVDFWSRWVMDERHGASVTVAGERALSLVCGFGRLGRTTRRRAGTGSHHWARPLASPPVPREDRNLVIIGLQISRGFGVRQEKARVSSG